MCFCVETINDTKLVKARKDYRDNCREFIMEAIDMLRNWRNEEWPPVTFREWRLIAESIRDGWIIKKGTIHECTVNKMEGHIYTFRNKPGLHAICHKYELYPEC